MLNYLFKQVFILVNNIFYCNSIALNYCFPYNSYAFLFKAAIYIIA